MAALLGELASRFRGVQGCPGPPLPGHPLAFHGPCPSCHQVFQGPALPMALVLAFGAHYFAPTPPCPGFPDFLSLPSVSSDTNTLLRKSFGPWRGSRGPEAGGSGE